MNVSFWLEDTADDLTPRPPLDGDVEVDVAIAGAGFTGLWTARELLRRDPALRVLICEAQTAGFGASGRNGAWLTAGLGVGPTELARRTSPETARATVEAMRETIDLVADAVREDGIDAQLRRGGILRVARGRHEIPALERAATELGRLGLEHGIAVLDRSQLSERVQVADACGALADAHAAAIHPGRLVRGLARRVESLGATIAERTPVRRVVPRSGSHRPRLETARGTITADAVVLACEAWQSQLPGYERSVLPVYSLVVLTEPLDAVTWESLGWAGHELLSSHRYTVDYLSRTPDGRVLFGGRGAPYHFRSRIEPRFDRHATTHALLRAQLTDWFPQLAAAEITHEWGGPLGMPRDWLPSFTFDPATGVGGAFGYTGQGVAATNLAGRVLADLIVHGHTPYQQLPMVGHRPRRWEPEPLRWMGARYLQVALARLDARSARTGRPPTGRSLAERLVRH
jgi:glycine/D-amino acid oxidase-like deaminating enzyme